MGNNVKNLGQAAGMVRGDTPPVNTTILWYDTTISVSCPIKYYDLTTNNWELLKDIPN